MTCAAEKLECIESRSHEWAPATVHMLRAGDGLTVSETIKSADVRLKRAYDPAGPEDGRRILVDRLWPRGLSKAEAGIDEWLKDLAPSTELRKWFGHDPARWAEFQRRYEEEIHGHPEALAQLRKLAREGTLTFVYSARDELHNDAVVLRRVLLEEQRATPEEDDRAR